MENKKGSLSTVFLVIAVILIIVMGVFMYMQIKNTEDKILELSEQISKLEQNDVTNEEDAEKDNVEKEEGVIGTFIDYSKDTTVVEDGNSEKIKGENTLKYSLLRENDYTHEFYEKYCSVHEAEGDSAAWEEIESNYGKSSPVKVGKYTKTIECDIAVLNEAGNYNDTMTLKDKVTTMWNAIKNNDFYKNDKYKLNGISIMNGNNNSEEDYNNNARAKKIKVTVNNDKSYTFELKDTNKPQVFDIGVEQEDISKVMNVTIEVLETYKGLVSDDVYINEIGFGISTGGLGAR